MVRPARSPYEFARAIRTSTLRYGGTRGTKCALVGTYVGLSVGKEVHPAPSTASFHLKLHAPATRIDLVRPVAPALFLLGCVLQNFNKHSITFMPSGGPDSVPDNQLLESEIC